MLTRDSVTVSVDAVVYYRLKRLDQKKYYTVPIFHMTFMISLRKSSLCHQMPNPHFFFFFHLDKQTDTYGRVCNATLSKTSVENGHHSTSLLSQVHGDDDDDKVFLLKKLIYEEITPMCSSRRSSPIFWEQKICMKFSGKLSKITFFISLQQISRLMKSLPVTVRQLHLV